mmetsp:Transcript_3131/g.3614  ORF Transcript_3131/g.3614 Transcript_3131/m.3614 type:complete len:235 (+) Transcript_3131:85-789(+)|eukprot:CAMPEP_0204621788 /NCGR_PEP_ID=MMETSP0717-20131115/7434_1 /ASSEMBLY_ACC=CAM_ASM_000666 /TAXON_ID=230516 /ORGANISM="Chaetoceros curvisetus" /LENGTH=234 /DNA_ID=CAMNT_0051636285 /DNA_START=17 /DNA_END=721 /DNA_ORIENTATION=-
MNLLNLSIVLFTLPHLAFSWVSQPIPAKKYHAPTCALSMSQGPGGGRQSKKVVDDMMEFINEPVPSSESVDQSFVDEGPPEDDDMAPLVRVITKAADMRKAESIIAMRISKVSTVASFVVICTGNSRPQNQAIAAAITDDVVEAFGEEYPLLGNGVPEGTADSGWILLDFGDVLVHVMTPKSRLFYDIEGQWKEKNCEYMNLDDVLLPNSVDGGVSQIGGTMTDIAEEDDPFWS